MAFALNTGVDAQRGMRGRGADSLNVMRHKMYMDRAQAHGQWQPGDTAFHPRMHDRYAWGYGYGRMMPGNRPWYGGRGWMQPMPPFEGRGWRQPMPPFEEWNVRPYANRPGMGRIDNIPGLTDKQKEQIAAIRKQQQEEMQKFREETAAKMKAIRSSNHEKILNILTDEQKKYLENPAENQPSNPKQAPKSK